MASLRLQTWLRQSWGEDRVRVQDLEGMVGVRGSMEEPEKCEGVCERLG